MVPRLIGEMRAMSAQLPELIEHNLLTPLRDVKGQLIS